MREEWEHCPQCRVLGGPSCSYCCRPLAPLPPALVDLSDLPMSEVLLVQGQGGPICRASLLDRAAPAPVVGVEPYRPRPDIVKIHNFIMSGDNDTESKLRVLDEAIAIASGDDLQWLRKERRRVDGRYPADLTRQFVEHLVANMLQEGYAVRVFGGRREMVKLTTDFQAIVAGTMTTNRDTFCLYYGGKDAPLRMAFVDYPRSSEPTLTMVQMPNAGPDVMAAPDLLGWLLL